MNLWLVAIAAGILTFAIRLSFISLLDGWEMPALLRRALDYVPPAVLSAIVFPELLLRDGTMDLSAGNYRLLAGIAAIAVAWRFRKIMPTLAAGMVLLWLLEYLQP
jgi:branched-subunit amino acid transport protein